MKWEARNILGKTYSTAAGAYSAAVSTAERVGPPGRSWPACLHWNLQGTEWKLYDAEGKPFNYIGTGTEDFLGSRERQVVLCFTKEDLSMVLVVA
jgi:hypothetical protein